MIILDDYNMEICFRRLAGWQESARARVPAVCILCRRNSGTRRSFLENNNLSRRGDVCGTYKCLVTIAIALRTFG
jgi:hypothetical protein